MMWEIIKSNQRKSWLIFLGMGFCLILLGWLIGEAILPSQGGASGILAAGVIWTILSLISYFSGDSIVLSSSHAKEVTREMHPMLFNIVEEMKIAASLPAIPRIYIIDDPAPNAFATGRSPEKSAVAVTAGLLQMCTRDELQGVIAHEMSHILNRDVLYVTFAGVLLGSITLLAEVFLRSLRSSGSSRRYRSDNNGGGQAQAIMLVIALVFAVLAPILARLLYFSLSRKREYLADACAVRLTRYPEGLASALEKISGTYYNLSTANSITAPMYISSPFPKKTMSLFNFSTHPPIIERIKILRNIHQGANFRQYMDAYSSIKGKASLIPDSAMKDNAPIPLLNKEKTSATPQGSRKELFDLMRAVNNFTFINCLCGLKIKVPPNYNNPLLACPKCGKKYPVPDRSSEQKKNKKKETNVSKKEQVFIRKQNGWETVTCGSCGKNIQLSPGFTNSKLFCQSCGQTIIVHSE